MAIEDEVTRMVAEVLERSEASIGLEQHFLRDLGASSLDLFTLMMRIEQVYGLPETPDEVIADVQTVGDLIELVGALRSGEAVSEGEESERWDVAIANDHAGVAMKMALLEYLRARGLRVLNCGTDDHASVDYPDYAARVAHKVRDGAIERGVLICGSGIGIMLAANKVRGVRAALVSEPYSARMAREHNDANILCLGARTIGQGLAEACVDAFFDASFTPGDDGRHRRRVAKIDRLAEREAPSG